LKLNNTHKMRVVAVFLLLIAAIVCYDTKYTPSLFILDHCSPSGGDYLLFWVDNDGEGHITQREVDGVITLVDFHTQCDATPHIQFNREIQIGPSVGSTDFDGNDFKRYITDDGTPGEIRFTNSSTCAYAFQGVFGDPGYVRYSFEDLEIYLEDIDGYGPGWVSLTQSYSHTQNCTFYLPSFEEEAPEEAPDTDKRRSINLFNNDLSIVDGSLLFGEQVILDSVLLREKITSYKKLEAGKYEITTQKGSAELHCFSDDCLLASLVFPNSPKSNCLEEEAGLFKTFSENLFACSKLPSGTIGSSSVYSWIKL